MKTAAVPEHLFRHPNHINKLACYSCVCEGWFHNGSESQALKAYEKHEAKETAKAQKPAVERDSLPCDVAEGPLDRSSVPARGKRIRQLADGLDASHHHLLSRIDYATSIIEEAELARAALIDAARAAGESWTKIGQVVGTSKQAAAKKYGTPVASTRVDPDQLTIV